MTKLSRHFLRKEFACHCGCGGDTVDAELLTVLEDLRARFGKAIKITSGYRCEKHNKAVGGGKTSQHLLGRAADVQVAGVPPQNIYNFLNSQYSTTFGIGSYGTFTHIDTRSAKARW